MSRLRRFGIVTITSTLVASILACPREKVRTNPGGTASTTPLAATDTAEPPDTLVHWDSAAGPALVLSMDSLPDTISVIRPEYTEGRYSDTTMVDLRSLSHTRFDLFGRGGGFGSVMLTTSSLRWHAGSSDDDCVQWPTAAIAPARRGWHVALQAGTATAIPLDSISAMSPGDSALFVAQVTRIASFLPKSPDPAFQAVPVTVRSAYRFQTAVIDGVIASLQRNIPSEATAREEDVFLIAERPVGSSQDYQVAFFTRVDGKERDATVADVLALVTLTRNGRLAVIVSDEDEDGGTIGWIERAAPRQWGMTWRSAYIGC
ncbi:MAG TPA: hypothetical protein VNU46_09815 [Gemmatimonadaceae bacterium]|nr:hypothetical protein [Gemmatimonadaceae bacterium]